MIFDEPIVLYRNRSKKKGRGGLVYRGRKVGPCSSKTKRGKGTRGVRARTWGARNKFIGESPIVTAKAR